MMTLSVTELERLSDAELRQAARNPLSEEDRAKLEALNYEEQRRALKPTERRALDRLVRRYDEAVLQRAEALRLLKERGLDIDEILTAR